jgi:hypothetical protein
LVARYMPDRVAATLVLIEIPIILILLDCYWVVWLVTSLSWVMV